MHFRREIQNEFSQRKNLKKDFEEDQRCAGPEEVRGHERPLLVRLPADLRGPRREPAPLLRANQGPVPCVLDAGRGELT